MSFCIEKMLQHEKRSRAAFMCCTSFRSCSKLYCT